MDGFAATNSSRCDGSRPSGRSSPPARLGPRRASAGRPRRRPPVSTGRRTRRRARGNRGARPPSSQARRNPASNESPAPGRVDRVDRHRRDAEDRAIRPGRDRAVGPQLDRDRRPAVRPPDRPGPRQRQRGRLDIVDAGDPAGLLGIRQEDVGDPEDARGPRRPTSRGVPVRVERRRLAAVAGRGEERRQPLPARPLEEDAPEWRWRARSTASRGTASTSSASMVPSAVSIARSVPLERITVAPVGRAGSTVHAVASIPRAASSSSMNRPSASSPTTPANATRSPSRAAPQAKIADELPTVMADGADQPLHLAEDRDRVRVGDDDVRVDLPDDQDVDRGRRPSPRSVVAVPAVARDRRVGQPVRPVVPRTAGGIGQVDEPAEPGARRWSPGTRRGPPASISRRRPRPTARPGRRSPRRGRRSRPAPRTSRRRRRRRAAPTATRRPRRAPRRHRASGRGP